MRTPLHQQGLMEGRRPDGSFHYVPLEPQPQPWLRDEDVTLYLGDAAGTLAKLPKSSVDAIVTSPPYADQRAYGGADPSAFVPWIEPVLVECLRVLKPTGSMMLNLGRIMRQGEEHPYALETLRRARELGWKWIDTIIWHKTNAIPLSHPAYLHGMHEFGWWLAPSVDAYRGYTTETRRPHAEGTLRRIGQPYMTGKDERYRKRGNTNELHPDGARPASVFAHGVGSERGIKHPAVMALGVARHFVALTSKPGDVVLDPFMGSGTTAVACRALGRKSIGIDHHEDYLKVAAGRLAQGALTSEEPAA